MSSETEKWKKQMLERAGITIDTPITTDLQSLKLSEWSYEFEQLMKNRLLMGCFRYGKLGGKDKPKYNRVKDIRRRLDSYEKNGNIEHLVDIANLALCEFVEGDHPSKHFASEDDGIHTEEE